MTTSRFLQALTGMNAGCIYVLADKAVLGRSAEATIQVMDPQVSREHANLTREKGETMLADLDSANGTFIGDARIERRRLSSGDVLRIGASAFVFGEVEGEIDEPEAMKRAVKVVNFQAMRESTLVLATLEEIRRALAESGEDSGSADIDSESDTGCADPLHDLAGVRGWAHCPACGQPIAG